MTAYSPHRLASFAHGLHERLKVDDVISIFSLVNSTCYNAKVINVDKRKIFHDFKEKDLILLECEQEV